MFALVGLGNPGSQYADNRHNVGFMALEEIAKAFSFPPFQKKDKVLLTAGKCGSKSLLLLQPQNYMNLSGPPLVPFFMFYKIPLDHCFVFHDELDLPLGKIRIKTGGGAGGHNGLRSLDQHLGNAYHRVRIGIDHPGHKDRVNSHVLSNFSDQERPVIDRVLHQITTELETLLDHNFSLFMNRLSESSTT